MTHLSSGSPSLISMCTRNHLPAVSQVVLTYYYKYVYGNDLLPVLTFQLCIAIS